MSTGNVRTLIVARQGTPAFGAPAGALERVGIPPSVGAGMAPLWVVGT